MRDNFNRVFSFVRKSVCREHITHLDRVRGNWLLDELNVLFQKSLQYIYIMFSFASDLTIHRRAF